MKIKISFLVLCFLLISNYNYGQTDEATAQGQKIGGIIKAAIDTALPGVTTILGLLWPKGEKKEIKIKKDDFEKKVAEAREEIQKQTKANFQDNLKPVKVIHDELFFLKQYLLPIEFIKLKTNVIIEKLNNPSPDWLTIKDEYVAIKKYHDLVRGVDTKKLRNPYVRMQYDRISNYLHIEVLDRLSRYLENSDKINSVKYLEELQTSTKDISLLFAYQLDDLESEFKALVDWSNAEASGDKVNQAESNYQSEIKKLIGNKYENK